MIGEIALLLSVLGAADGRPEPPGELAAQVRRLVAELDAPELARRQTAEAELVNLGPRALDFLPDEAGPGKAEAAQRLARVRRKLEQAQASRGFQASRVSLEGKMPLAGALESIEKQTGNAFTTSRLPNATQWLERQFDLAFRQEPFWPTLDAILGKAGLEVYPFGEQGRIELTVSKSSPDLSQRRVVYAGPLRLELLAVQAQRDFRSGTGSLKLDIEAAWEPRLVPIRLKQRMAEVEGVDDRGRRLGADAPEATLEIPVPRGPIASRFTLPLALPPRDARALRELRGVLGVLAAGPVSSFRFTDLGRFPRVVKRMAGGSVTLEGATQVGNTLEIRILVRFDAPDDALASHRTWIFNNPALLETPDGKAIRPESTSPTRQTAEEVGIALLFRLDRAVEDYAFVYQTPTTILNVPLEYCFRDVPLP